MDTATLEAFEAYIETKVPGFRVAYKEDSKLMSAFGLLLRLSNPKFMSDYITTWGNTIYFPSRTFYEKDALRTLITLSHEFVHLQDAQERGFLAFKGAYASPQIFVLLPLALYAALGGAWPLGLLFCCYLLSSVLAYKSQILGLVTMGVSFLGSLLLGWCLSKFWVLLIPAAFVFLCLPSRGRTLYELRGYAMNFGFIRWVFDQEPTPLYFETVRSQFLGSSYLFMSWSRSSVEKSLQAAIKQAAEGTLQNEGPYREVYAFLASHGLLAR